MEQSETQYSELKNDSTQKSCYSGREFSDKMMRRVSFKWMEKTQDRYYDECNSLTQNISIIQYFISIICNKIVPLMKKTGSIRKITPCVQSTTAFLHSFLLDENIWRGCKSMHHVSSYQREKIGYFLLSRTHTGSTFTLAFYIQKAMEERWSTIWKQTWFLQWCIHWRVRGTEFRSYNIFD